MPQEPDSYREDDHFEQDRKPAARVEVEIERTKRPDDGAVPIEMGNGETVYVPMQAEWPKSGMDAMRVGNFDVWAEEVLSEELGDLELWEDWMATNPKMGAIEDFFGRLGKVTGMAARGNRASRRSSTRTPRR